MQAGLVMDVIVIVMHCLYCILDTGLALSR